MGNTIEGERYSQTLGLHPGRARRGGSPLFLGRALPVVVNGFVCSIVALALGALVLRVTLPLESLPLLTVVIAGRGLSPAPASAWRPAPWRCGSARSAVLSNIIMGS